MVPYAHLQFIKIVEKVVDARRDDDGVLEVRLGVTTKQMRPYTHLQLIKIVEKVPDTRNGDDGVSIILLGAMTK